tara:strand:- start:114 stop:434 length:321 start_codon:yes stop_codon:yes gene_type:complete
MDTITDFEILSFQLTNDYAVVYQGVDDELEYDRLCGIALVRRTQWRQNEHGMKAGEPLNTWTEMTGLEFGVELGRGEFIISGEAVNYVGLRRVSELNDEQKLKLRG